MSEIPLQLSLIRNLCLRIEEKCGDAVNILFEYFIYLFILMDDIQAVFYRSTKLMFVSNPENTRSIGVIVVLLHIFCDEEYLRFVSRLFIYLLF